MANPPDDKNSRTDKSGKPGSELNKDPKSTETNRPAPTAKTQPAVQSGNTTGNTGSGGKPVVGVTGNPPPVPATTAIDSGKTAGSSAAPASRVERGGTVQPKPASPATSLNRPNNQRPPADRPPRPHRPTTGELRERHYRDRKPTSRPGSRPVARDSRPRRRMAPPPGARNGRYIAPAARPVRRGYIVPPAQAADAGTAWGPLLLGLLLLLGVLWYAIKHYAPTINADLTTRTNSALVDAGFNSTEVKIDGRTATLSGTVPTQPDSDRAEEVVANTIGVRSVDNQLTIGGGAEPTSADRSQPSLAFLATDNGVQLTGTVSDQEYADKIVTAAKEMYGDANITNEIEVDETSTNPGWWPAVQQLSPDLKNVDGGSFSVSDGSLKLTGTASEQIKGDIGTKAEQLLKGQLTVDNQISVVRPLQPSYGTYYYTNDRIELSGKLPIDSAIQVEQSFVATGKPVKSFIIESEDYAAPAWAENFADSVAAMEKIADGRVEIQRSGDVVISGTAGSDDAKQSAADQVATIFSGQTISNNIAVEIVPGLTPYASVTDTGAELKLTGLLPTAAVEKIVASYESAGRTVTSTATIDETAMEPAWIEAMSSAPQNMSNIENAMVNIGANDWLIISGTAANESDRTLAADNILAAFGDSVSLRNDIKVKGPDITQLFGQIDLAAIRFRSNRAELDADSISILNQVADALTQVPDATVAINGHTDSTGNNDRNLVLSAERADTVKSFLINAGISGDRMTSRGYGSSQPIASNDTNTGRALNRRIEFALTNGE